MVNKLDDQTFTTEFESHWVPHPYVIVPHLNIKLSNLLHTHTHIQHLERLHAHIELLYTHTHKHIHTAHTSYTHTHIHIHQTRMHITNIYTYVVLNLKIF